MKKINLFRGLCEVAIRLDCPYEPTLKQIGAVIRRQENVAGCTVADDYNVVLRHMIDVQQTELENCRQD